MPTIMEFLIAASVWEQACEIYLNMRNLSDRYRFLLQFIQIEFAKTGHGSIFAVAYLLVR